jgi:DinB superfamily
MTDWLEEFRRTIESTSERLLPIPDSRAGTPPAPGKWSPKEIVGHLIDSAAHNHQRFVRGQFTDDLVFPGYDQELWVQTQRYCDEPWSQLVQLWRLYNLHLLHVMSLVPDAASTKLRQSHNLNDIAWQTVATSEPVTLEYFMRDYVNHLQHHLDQIFAILTAPAD